MNTWRAWALLALILVASAALAIVAVVDYCHAVDASAWAAS
jgi:hypothetical protein